MKLAIDANNNHYTTKKEVNTMSGLYLNNYEKSEIGIALSSRLAKLYWRIAWEKKNGHSTKSDKESIKQIISSIEKLSGATYMHDNYTSLSFDVKEALMYAKTKYNLEYKNA